MAAGGARLPPPRRVLAVQHAAAADAAQTQQQHERAQAAALRAQQLPVAAYRSSERRGPVALLLPSLAALSLAVAASLPPPARAADDLLSSAAQALIRNAVTETLSRSADEERTEEAPAADEQGRVILRTPSGVQYSAPSPRTPPAKQTRRRCVARYRRPLDVRRLSTSVSALALRAQRSFPPPQRTCASATARSRRRATSSSRT